MDPMRIEAGRPAAVAQAGPAAVSPAKPGSFGQLLAGKIEAKQGLTFSRHAEHRMQSRQVSLSGEEKARLENAVDRAAGKGARESLVLLDRMAFVVNVQNRTVLTAMPEGGAREGIFTNIDSAVPA